MKRTAQLVKEFAQTCADAYVNQFVDPDGRKVMNDPIVYYNVKDDAFAWCSSLTPLNEYEVRVETIECNVYGETGDDVEIARDGIESWIISDMNVIDLLDKIEPIQEEYEAETKASESAAALGKIGGASRSEAKQAASRINGTKGGRPKKS